MAGKPERTEQLPASAAIAQEATEISTEAVPAPTTSGTVQSTTLGVGEAVGNRFKVIRLVARGGMGEVYEATDLALGTRIAIKTLRPGTEVDDEQLARLKREVLLARQITHPNVCRIFEFFESNSARGDPVTFLTMEYLEGETLRSRLQSAGPMRHAEALELLKQMAEGLGAIHAQGIVHRDFKSNNVMLVPSANGRRAVVMDFGIARQELDRELAVTREGVVIGTPDYMAPEQRRGEEASIRSDVYAFGAVACEMVTGHLPVNGAATGAGRHWRRVLGRALAENPERRFSTPRAMLEALGKSFRAARVAILLAIVATLALVGMGLKGPALRALADIPSEFNHPCSLPGPLQPTRPPA